MLGVTPSCPLLPARPHERAVIVAGAVAPGYHQPTPINVAGVLPSRHLRARD